MLVVSKSIYTKRDGLLVVPKIYTRKEMVNCLLSIDIKSDGLLVLRVSTQKAMVCFSIRAPRGTALPINSLFTNEEQNKRLARDVLATLATPVGLVYDVGDTD